MIQKSTELGNIDLSNDVIATICGGAATECYGVVGMASQKMIDGIYDLLRKENYSKGIKVENGESGAVISLYIIVGYGVKISEIVYEVQKSKICVRKDFGYSGRSCECLCPEHSNHGGLK